MRVLLFLVVVLTFVTTSFVNSLSIRALLFFSFECHGGSRGPPPGDNSSSNSGDDSSSSGAQCAVDGSEYQYTETVSGDVRTVSAVTIFNY